MESMVYVVVRMIHGDFVFDKVFCEKFFAEQYVFNLNNKIGKNIAKIIPTEMADTDFYNKNKNKLKEIAKIYCKKDVKLNKYGDLLALNDS